ncbi:hypothetical protein QLS71_007800 [Mariniflexile litorale]|uniref:Uncharacterized protein n=1 Tax=Mariniflexile litorale TaxID=3045158 RepID=A0AAU7EKL1_9FLAO|nr:hypothetical protein [Mariniflexile sp. KMM 9835]MDQ8213235.1 hypothetical protein [Mariniflexile sp. KMM 9835]
MKKLAVLFFFSFFISFTEAQTTTSLDVSEEINEKIEKALNDMLSEGKDAMKIVSVTPIKNLIDGSIYEFSVIATYSLISKEQAILNIGFNNGSSEKSHRLISDASKIINNGTSYHIFKVKAKVVDWSKIGGAFYVSTNMSEYPHERKWSPLASDRFFLKVD